ncbi:acetyltransferase [Geothrix oryzae]|uniref:acetyltransferase n=1 Tax=Geothrix oryzae TaxID=2927975 RepID=UPI002572B4A3|nr:acetyltransferase [Geothrix oryzae]
MNKPQIILVGAGGHCHSCLDVIEQQNIYEIAGLIDKETEIGSLHLGYKVIGTDADLSRLSKSYSYALITIGQIESSENRVRLYEKVQSLGFKLPIIISPRAYVSKNSIVGDGSVILHGAIVNAGSAIGNNCIINTSSLIEHDVSVGNHCHISTGAILNGDVTIGNGSFVGSGVTIKQGVRIGKECIVGMGLTVRHDLADYTRFIG